MVDYIEFDDEFSIARTIAPQFTWGRTLAESAPRTEHGVTIVGVKRTGEDFTYARPETTVHRHDHLIVSGPTAASNASAASDDIASQTDPQPRCMMEA